MYIKIKPRDTLFFRDGKPFNSGEETWANTGLLPNPSVLWGSIASLFYAYGVDPKDLEEFLKIKKIYLYNEETGRLYLPAPRDLFIDENGVIYNSRYKKNNEDLISCLDFPFYVYPATEKKVKNADNLFMDISSLCNEYYEQTDSPYCITLDRILIADHKVGITRNKTTKSSVEGMLYRLDLIQFKKDWGFLVEIDGIDTEKPDEGFLKLGGEGKAAKYSIIKEDIYFISKFKNDLDRIIKENNDAHYFKIILTSHSIFKKGSYPDILDRINIPGVSIKLAAASIGKALPIGGFDVKNGLPKKMRRAVPAGSVYLINLQRKEKIPLKDIIDTFRKCFISIDKNRGFGGFEILPL